ncbi:hypothetical protein CHS0354_040944 [Potamilus streckersoni]|uniref:Uncharacterized protein n=1 Tax=Potamilus streckersoni TaxID=2493646 RepID=A0AAE0W8G4_9BIVA|nr:hypothetical protein CHS0354_040944 [Potamilus streckersoni]
MITGDRTRISFFALVGSTICVIIFYHNFGLMQKCIKDKRAKSQTVAPAYKTRFLEEYRPDPFRYLIDTCTGKDQCEGWGDRQRAMVTTYLISLITNRTFGILMDTPCELTKTMVPNKINWNISKHDLAHLTSRDFYMHNDQVNNFQFHKKIETVDLDKEFSEPVIYFHTTQDYVTAIRRNMNSADRIPWLHKLSLSNIYGIILRNLLSPSDEVQRLVSEFMLKEVRGRTLVCAHIRMGFKEVEKLRTQTNEVGTIWNFLSDYKNSSDYAIYVATDKNETKEEARQLFKNGLVDMNGLIEFMHYDVSCNGFQNAIIEHIILTKCNILLLTRSSFGITAAYIRDTNEGLYCLFKNRIFPCSMEVFHELHEAVL